MRIRYQTCVLAATLVVALAMAPAGWAQSNCKPFRALIQAIWIDPTGPLPASGVYGWQGPFLGTLDGQEVSGFLSANPNATAWVPTITGAVGTEGSPSEKLDFGGGNYFVTVADNKGVFPTPPGKGGWLMGYIETAKIDEGQGGGIFKNASGTLAISGPGIAYPVDFSNLNGAWFGFWNGEINGRICNVAP